MRDRLVDYTKQDSILKVSVQNTNELKALNSQSEKVIKESVHESMLELISNHSDTVVRLEEVEAIIHFEVSPAMLTKISNEKKPFIKESKNFTLEIIAGIYEEQTYDIILKPTTERDHKYIVRIIHKNKRNSSDISLINFDLEVKTNDTEAKIGKVFPRKAWFDNPGNKADIKIIIEQITQKADNYKIQILNGLQKQINKMLADEILKQKESQ